MIQSFEVTEDHSGWSYTINKDTIVYKCKYHDYGLASDDSSITGIEHISVTLNPEGDYPSFTIPVNKLRKVNHV